MKARVGQRFSIAPLRPITPGPPIASSEGLWNCATRFPTIRRSLEEFYGVNTQAFAEWLAELYWRSRKNIVPDDGDVSGVMACKVKGVREGAPFAAAWVVELLFSGGPVRSSWAVALETVEGPMPPTAELAKMAKEINYLSAWLYHNGMEQSYRRAERHTMRKIRGGLRKALRGEKKWDT